MNFGDLFSTLLSLATTYAVIAIIGYILMVVAWWKIFTKAGEAGWKSLIPLYNVYVLFKITWKTLVFWIVIVCYFVSGIIGNMDSDSSIVNFLGWLCSTAPTVILLVYDYKLSKAFGHGLPFAIGLMIPGLKNIFLLILAFGKSKYVGNGETKVLKEHHTDHAAAKETEASAHAGSSHLKQ